MPVYGERAAPTFSPNRPNEIRRYFAQLERLFARSNITTDAIKKSYVTSYVDADTADIWEALTEFKDVSKTYDDLKDRLLELYNQISLKYILTDLDRLVGERQRIGVKSLQELSEFHLKFNAISTYLIAADLLSKREQTQVYLRIFDASILSSLQVRLQIQHPQHHPSLPYGIDDIFEAAKWVLQGVTPPSMLAAVTSPPAAESTSNSMQPPSSEYIKKEQLSAMFSEFSKVIADALKASTTKPSGGGSAPKNSACNGCGDPDHFINNCKKILEYIASGKCKRNAEGKVVLPNGYYIPRDIPGRWLIERIDEWHKRNPGQVVTGTMLHEITSTATLVPTQAHILANRGEPTSAKFEFSAEDRIAALEAEIYSLKAKKRNDNETEGVRTRKQRAAKAADPQVQELPSNTTEATKSGPIHPFRQANDATYAPPSTRNVGAPPKAPATTSKKSETAYKTLPPIHDPDIAKSVYDRVLKTPLTVTTHELLSLSPEVHTKLREAATNRRTPKVQEDKTEVKAFAAEEEEEEDLYEEAWTSGIEVAESFMGSEAMRGRAIYTDDIFEQYYRNLRPGEKPDPD